MIGREWTRVGITMGLMAFAGSVAGTSAQEASAKSEPEKYGGIVMVTNAPARGVVHFRLTVDRWSTDEERKAYVEAIKAGGSDGLAAAMEKVTVGYIQLDQNLRYPIAYAVKGPTDKGVMIRVATNRPISIKEQNRGFVSKGYPIGVVELLLPPEGPGNGSILGAARVQFNDKGQLEVESLPQNTGPQRVEQVEREVPKPKKEMKK